jgi:hypothetical protein
MCSHCLVDPVACTPASGWEKGQVENNVHGRNEERVARLSDYGLDVPFSDDPFARSKRRAWPG